MEEFAGRQVLPTRQAYVEPALKQDRDDDSGLLSLDLSSHPLIKALPTHGKFQKYRKLEVKFTQRRIPTINRSKDGV